MTEWSKDRLYLDPASPTEKRTKAMRGDVNYVRKIDTATISANNAWGAMLNKEEKGNDAL